MPAPALAAITPPALSSSSLSRDITLFFPCSAGRSKSMCWEDDSFSLSNGSDSEHSPSTGRMLVFLMLKYSRLSLFILSQRKAVARNENKQDILGEKRGNQIMDRKGNETSAKS
jgi:hypothetical protein